MTRVGRASPEADAEDQLVELPSGIRLCCRSLGDESDTDDRPTILLLVGLGLQLVYWPAELLRALTAGGYRVLLVDNRDSGRSSRMATRPPGKWQQLTARPPADNYTLEDMADDVAGLLDQLGLRSVHAVGMSMGGMIAQALASRHPARVETLTSIFSTTGRRNVGQPALSTLWRISRAKPPRTRDEAVRTYIAIQRHIGRAGTPGIEAVWAAYAELAWERNGGRADSAAFARQIGAVHQSGDRTEALRCIAVPTLVVHGDIDLMVHPSGGHATAQAIPGARLELLLGMRHAIDASDAATLAAMILAHTSARQEFRQETV